MLDGVKINYSVFVHGNVVYSRAHLCVIMELYGAEEQDVSGLEHTFAIC